MATVTVVRYKRRKRLGDDKSPMMYLLKPKAGEFENLFNLIHLAQEIEVYRVAFGGRRVARHEIFRPCDEEGLGGRR